MQKDGLGFLRNLSMLVITNSYFPMRLVIAILLFFLPHFVQSQDHVFTDPGLKIYTDKTIYSLDERIWFSAILTKATIADTVMPFHTLFLALINPASKAVIKTSRFALLNGCASGSISLPDSAMGKELVLIGYTNNFSRNEAELPFIKTLAINTPLRHVANAQLSSHDNTVSKSVLSKLMCDSVSYNNRSKVTCRLKIQDSLNLPLRGVFSFSCVRDRFAPLIVNNYNDNNVINIDRNFRKLINNKSNDLWELNRGTVQLFDKPIKKSIKIILNNGGKMEVIQTTGRGDFTFNPMLLYGSDTSAAYFGVIGNIDQRYFSVKLPCDEDRINKIIAGLPDLQMQPVIVERMREMLDSGFFVGVPKLLKEVQVKGRDLTDWGYASVDTSCEAFTCINGHLNCPYLPNLIRAEPGKTYPKYFPSQRTFMPVEFAGCEEGQKNRQLRIIHLPTSFQGLDSNTIKSPESFKSTTVFWSPLIVTDDNGEAEVTFYTNDLPGNFICTVRGLSTLGEFKAQTMFTVKME